MAGRHFIDDPVTAGNVAAGGDTTAAVIEIVNLLTAGKTAAERAVFDNALGVLTKSLAASDASRKRERKTRELLPVTMIPTEDYGNEIKMSSVKFNTTDTFYGNGSKDENVFTWLNRVMALSRIHRLKLEVIPNVMLLLASGGAAEYLLQMMDEKQTLTGMVQAMESRYATTINESDAMSNCTSLKRVDGESLQSFIDGLRHLAAFACRET